MATLPRLAIVAVLGTLGGCELFANVPSYANLGDGGGEGGDGSNAECQMSTQCAAPEVCVMGQCQLCDRDAHCGDATADVCLVDGTCAARARIAYASPGGTGVACTLANQCSVDQAFSVAAASAPIDIVKLAQGTYPRDVQLTIGTDTVIVGGEGAILMAADLITLFRVTTGRLTLIGAELVGMGSFNALCYGTVATLGTMTTHRVVSRAGTYGLAGFNCNMIVSRSSVLQNTSIGLYVSAGTVRITNSVVMGNGVDATAQGGLQLLAVTDARVESSTIIGNTSVDDLYGGGLTCTGSTNVVTSSISWGNVGAALAPLDAECNVDYSVVEPSYTAGAHNVRTDPLFLAVGNFHVQPTSPARGAGDPALTVGVDFDNEVRPQGGGAFDCGADEVP